MLHRLATETKWCYPVLTNVQHHCDPKAGS